MRYDYECPKCEHIQEEYHPMKESPTIKCGKCKTKMSKSFSTPQINMNVHPGSALHETDNI